MLTSASRTLIKETNLEIFERKLSSIDECFRAILVFCVGVNLLDFLCIKTIYFFERILKIFLTTFWMTVLLESTRSATSNKVVKHFKESNISII